MADVFWRYVLAIELPGGLYIVGGKVFVKLEVLDSVDVVECFT